MHVLLTRPSLQAELMRPLLEEIGCKVSAEPILNVSFEKLRSAELQACGAIVVTSVYASLQIVNAFSVKETTPIYAVGAGTAEPLRRAGFSQVFQASGDAVSLLDLILKEFKPTDGTITYLSGRNITRDIAQDLVSRGYTARRVVTYKADPSQTLSETTRKLLRQQSIDCVVFMSYRTAHYFTELCHSAGLSACLKSMTAATLSEKVSSGLVRAQWKEVKVADAPSNDAIVDLLCSKR